jgi:hypothetical protein
MDPRALLAVMALVPLWCPLSAQNVAGTWKASYRTPDGYAHECAFELRMDGAKLGGTISSRRGRVEISDGEVAGGRISFRVLRRGNGDELEVRFSGDVEGDVMNLAMAYRAHDPVQMTARRDRQESSK